MRAIFAFISLALLALVLTTLLVHAVDANAETFDRALAELDRLTKSEGALRGDLLAARAGLLRNYDPVVQQVNAIRASVDSLRNIGTGQPQVLASIDLLNETIERQEQLVEQFKSDNALLHNSLAHFARIGRSLQESEPTPAASLISAIIADVFHLTLDTSPDLLRETQGLLKDAAATAPSIDADELAAFLAHAHLLLRLLPQTDTELKSLTTLESAPGALRAVVLERQQASRATARRYRFLLYAASLLLAGALIYLALRLHARALATRRRAALERVVTAISTRFINAAPCDTEAGIDRALAELGQCVGADRAYFLFPGDGPRAQLWCRSGIGVPPDWPERAPELAVQFHSRLVHVADVRRLRPDARKRACISAGLRGWVFASGMSSRGPVFLGFDAVTQPFRITPAGELGVLPMALDLLAHAVERQTTELEKSRLEERLRQTRRMETVGALASGVAHNFNNIITAILGYVELAELQVTQGGRHLQHLGGIRRAGERGRAVVEQLLQFGRRRSARRQPIDVRSLMAESESFLRASLPREVKLVFHDSPIEASTVAEPAQLQQVILNLCSNAAQAMEGGGDITVETTLRTVADMQDLTHGTLAAGRYVVIAVTDRGRGMDRVVLQNLFEPFFTTKANGNGLGLATVREIVDDHRGAINVISSPGKGSRFEVWLPYQAAAGHVEMNETAERAFGRGQTILLLSSRREQLLHDEEILAALGYEPVGFWRPADAVAACRSHPDRFDAILVSCSPTGDDGRSLPALLHGIEPRLPIVVAAEPAEVRNAMVMAGVSEVVTRPIIADEIAVVLARCIQANTRAMATYRSTQTSASQVLRTPIGTAAQTEQTG